MFKLEEGDTVVYTDDKYTGIFRFKNAFLLTNEHELLMMSTDHYMVDEGSAYIEIQDMIEAIEYDL